MVDVHDSKSCEGNLMRVRVSPPAQIYKHPADHWDHWFAGCFVILIAKNNKHINQIRHNTRR